ncbi:biopolymer transporter ExbD [Luteibacter pinisoli]|uniref:Biopolymer transporter ExbD n=1 Tax=Luteibacter pinisoli TaxID=2589080 RepID=A0A4Y5Z539_9GAMM|nr:biopolymer transporter ExbD [Luteibacter pinisoli]QDE40371.1 biopolymer transporter ExbD [Luteibacter pinisoli]
MAFSAKVESSPFAGINVTPLVDVLLVLLIIFMISAPVIAHKNRIDLPSPSASEARRPDPLRITVDPGGMVFLNGTLVSDATLATQLDVASARGRDDATRIPHVELHARDEASYEDVARVLALARAHGVTGVDFASD